MNANGKSKRVQGKVSRAATTQRQGRGQLLGDIVLKTMTLSSQVLATSAGGVIPVTTSITSSLVQSGPAAEWASFAARYQQYRVRAVRIIAKAIRTRPYLDAAGVDNLVSSLYVADYIGTAVPASAAQVLSDENSKVLSTADHFVYETTWAKNPNAKLWNPTSAAIPAANLYGIALASSTLVGLLKGTTNQYTYVVEWDVELRGSQ